ACWWRPAWKRSESPRGRGRSRAPHCRAGRRPPLQPYRSIHERPDRRAARHRNLSLLGDRVLDRAHDGRQYRAADQAGHTLPDIGRSTAGHKPAETRDQPDDPRPDIAADQADDRIDRWVDADLLDAPANAVSANCTQDQLDDDTYPIHSLHSFP